jgi:hypothetical protein
MVRSIIAVILFLYFFSDADAQCCAGGGGSPIGGGASQGVLMERQFEINTSLQFISTDKFYNGSKEDPNKYFDSYSSSYQYLRLGYGVSKNFTMSVEGGYYHYRKEDGLDGNSSGTFESKGIGDLILFPKYDIVNRTKLESRTEVTLGLGFKIPLGTYNDSTEMLEPFSGTTYYVTNPQGVQPTSGAHDLIFYAFALRGYTRINFRLFANATYIKKGWNPAGEKQGDYLGVGLFAAKTFFEKLGVTFQLRGEKVDKTKVNDDILIYAYPNYDPEATGYKKLFFTPQLTYTHGKFTVYGLIDLPLYQEVEKIQVATGFQSTFGVSYRFFVTKNKVDELEDDLPFD